MSVDIERVQTADLTLQRLSASDYEDLCRMHRHEDVMRTLGGLKDDDWTAAFLRSSLAHWQRHGFGLWLLRDRRDHRFVGRGGLHRVPIDGHDEVEIAYALMPRYWGRGLATQVAKKSTEVAFETLGCESLFAFALPFNAASRRVMEKVGFEYEGDVVRADLPHVLYRLGRQRWHRDSADAEA